MGQEYAAHLRTQVFAPYQVTENLMKTAGADSVFLHCLPAHRGQEVTDTVIDSSRSLVYDQAENRLHVQKALLLLLMQSH
jgi:ornithine carbamoyltransferase